MKAHRLEDDMKEETRIALLEQSIGHISETLTRLDNKIDNGFNELNRHLDKIDGKMDKLEGRIWFNFYWTIAGFTGVLGLIAHALRWI